jgi:putative tricarboxylic transport membrane protein
MFGREGIAGLVCLVGSLVLLAATWGLPGPTLLVPVGPGFYPRIILGITAALSFALIVADCAAQRRRAPVRAKAGAMPENYGLVAACFAVFGLYVAALPWIGFRLSTFVFVAALQALLDPPRNRKNWGVLGATALVTTVVAYYLFEHHLLVLLPRGRWTDF